MTEFCLLRHAQTEQNRLLKIQGRKDYPLNEEGINQANRAGEYLAKNDNNFDLIIASPLIRAYKTALIVNEKMNKNLDVVKDERFIERCFGTAEGKDVCEESFIHILDDSEPGIEKSSDLKKRVYDGIIDLSNRYPNKRILIVTHSHTIKALANMINPEIHFTGRLDNCSVSYFICDNKKLSVEKYNIKTQ